MERKNKKDALRKVGGFADLKIEKIIRSPKEWYYRNKIELSCGLDENSNVCLGYHKQGDYAYILPIKECTIFSESFPEIIEVLNNYLKRNKIDNFDNQLNPNGYLQYVVIRKSEFLGSLMLNFITRNKPLPDIQGLIDDLNKVNPNVSIFHTINNGGVGYSSSIDVEMKRIYGAEFIEEKIGHLQFNITPFSFFQVNTLGAFQLYGVIKKFVSTNKNARVVDLYCGTGTIGQFISSEVKEVVGIEISKEAIASAKENLKINNIENCSYIAGDARKVLKFNMPLFKGADIVITDPPRAGMSKKALSRLLEIRSKVIIYVSCNPATLARDLRDIVEGGYSITEIQPVDMFPHTPHVETVVKLCKNKIKLDNI